MQKQYFEVEREEAMTEQIGKIILDLTHYPGEDYYCDGQVEDELLEIVDRKSVV